MTFFRTLGGATGVSALGAVLASRVSDLVAQSLAARGVPATGGIPGGGNLDVEALPAPMQEIVRAAYGDATGTLFLISALIAVVTVLAVVFIRETPLRDTLDLDEGPDEEPRPVRPSAAGHRPASGHATNPRLACARPRTDSRPEPRRPMPGAHRPPTPHVTTTRDT